MPHYAAAAYGAPYEGTLEHMLREGDSEAQAHVRVTSPSTDFARSDFDVKAISDMLVLKEPQQGIESTTS
jgi:hypothetical protein